MPAERTDHPTLLDGIRVWSRIAVLSFGGPAGQIAVMHRIIVDEKQWVSDEEFVHALNYCMLLPGPEAQQLATYLGWLTHRVYGGLLAGILFILPGFLAILGLSIVYVSFQETSWIAALFTGLKATVVVIVVEALLKIGKRILKNRRAYFLAGLSFVAIFFFSVPFPAIILSAAAYGWIHSRRTVSGGMDLAANSAQIENQEQTSQRQHWVRSGKILAICLLLWWGPILAIWFCTGQDSNWMRIGLFFSQTAVITFGGAYAVLSYLAQQAVDKYGWLNATEMLDGLGLAETTPGPLIMVVQFVGFLAAYRNPGSFHPLLAGLFGSVLTTWVTFVPCFLWVFLGAPYIDRLKNQRRLSEALSAITAAVVGVILNLAVWFAMHCWFSELQVTDWGLLRMIQPEWNSLQVSSLLISLLAGLLLFRARFSLLSTMAIGCLAGMVLYWINLS